MSKRMGNATLTMVNGGNFRLDGGAMHGVVPKTIWNRLVSCDEHNRCTYSTNCLLIEVADKRILVDTGNGNKFPPKLKEIYGIDHDRSIALALKDMGVDPGSIDYVILTHLHFDHAGGTTVETKSGLAAVFPRAQHIVQQAELDAALEPNERNRASYLAENYEPLAEQGLLRCVDGNVEIVPGIWVLPTPGHSRGHQSVVIDMGGEKAIFFGDVVPTAVHVRLPFIMGYDIDVEATLAAKKHVFARALDEHWLCLFGHDVHHGTYLTHNDQGQIVAGELIDL